MAYLSRFYLYAISIFSIIQPIFSQEPCTWFDKVHFSTFKIEKAPFFGSADKLFGCYNMLPKTSYAACKAVTDSVKDYCRTYGPLSQTESDIAYCLSSPFFWDEVVVFLNENPGYQDAICEAIQQERQINKNGGLVLYHVTNPINYAFHYIDTALYMVHKRVAAQEFVTTLKNPYSMLILRQGIPFDHSPSQTLKKYKNPPILDDPSDGYETAFSIHYDQQDDTRQFLLSCNGSLFGNFSEGGSSAFGYWTTYELPVYKQYLQFSFADKYPILPLDNKLELFTDAIKAFAESNQRGVMLQLCFTNKELLDEVSYVAHPGGFGYGPVEIEGVSYNTTSELLTRLRQGNLTSCDGSCEPLYKDGVITTSPLQQEADRINALQYRLILTQDLLLNPSNTRVAEYFSVHAYVENKQALDKFHTQIDALVAEIEKEATK